MHSRILDKAQEVSFVSSLCSDLVLSIAWHALPASTFPSSLPLSYPPWNQRTRSRKHGIYKMHACILWFWSHLSQTASRWALFNLQVETTFLIVQLKRRKASTLRSSGPFIWAPKSSAIWLLPLSLGTFLKLPTSCLCLQSLLYQQRFCSS